MKIQLPSAVLVALGLTGCDGCGTTLFACLEPPPVGGDAHLGPCLSPPPDVPVTPCLEPVPPPDPPPPPDVTPCLEPKVLPEPIPEVPVAPCLSEAPIERIQPCLSKIPEEPVHPCLSMPYPTPDLPVQPGGGDQGRAAPAAPPARATAVASALDRLPADTAARVRARRA